MSIADILKTIVILLVFVVLTVACINNIIRHRGEKKEAKLEKKRGGFRVAKNMKPEE